jgi:hypothetical protein
MSVLVATTTYDFVAGLRKLFQAGWACWVPGGVFCVAVSWLAAETGALKRAVVFLLSGENFLLSGEDWGPWKGPSRSSFRSAEQRAGHRAERSA